jgi:hypothetical protein
MCGALPQFPHVSYGMMLKHKDKFTFTCDNMGSLEFRDVGLILKLYIVLMICSSVLVTEKVRIPISTSNLCLRCVSSMILHVLLIGICITKFKYVYSKQVPGPAR